MKHLNKALSVFYAFFIFISCVDGKKENVIIEKSLTPDITVSQLSDSSYMSQVGKLIYENNKLYLSEGKRSQVIIFDKSLKHIYTVGRHGRGPAEMNGVNRFSFSNDTLFINDYGGKRMQLYLDNGKHIKYIPYGEISIDIDLGNGYVYSNNILIASSNRDSSFVKYDFNGDAPRLISSFGDRYEFGNHIQNRVRNSKFIDIINNKLVAVSDNMPFIELYSLDGKLLHNYDISKIPIIEEQLDFIAQMTLPENGFGVIIENYCIYNNSLYILCHTPSPEYRRNKVIKFSLEGNEFTQEAIYTLPSRYYSSVAVSDKYLYSFDLDKSAICRFEL